MGKYYIAYGSNLNIGQMRMRCPNAEIVGTAEIADYELLFKGSLTGSYLTIEKRKGGIVPIAVWEVTADDEKMLDCYEGYPSFYYKKGFDMVLDGKPVSAFAYIMHEERKRGLPSMAYLGTCIEGYKDFGFDKRLLLEAYGRSGKAADYDRQ